MPNSQYCHPLTKDNLYLNRDGLVGKNGECYLFLNSQFINKIPVFIDETLLSGGDIISNAMYKKSDSEVIYENFLVWLFKTFNEDAHLFRESLINNLHLKKGDRVLVTGCGLGDDLFSILPKIGNHGEIYAQDLSDLMITATARRLADRNIPEISLSNIYLDVSNASMLPYADGFFDAAFHFGGINLFTDVQGAISEMARVVKAGGKVLFGDEGVAPWLKDKEYGKMVIYNNSLWASSPPISLLPETASNVHLSWVLGNCFYIIDFEVSESLPSIDIDIPHKGIRGGSIRKRYYGAIEGIDPKIKNQISTLANSMGKSSSDWIEMVISNEINKTN